MAALESCPKHNMVAYLEKINGNAEFHEIIDFITRSTTHYALTVSYVVSTTFVEQFWIIAKSKTINNVRYITAIVAGKPVSILEASIRSDIQFNDAAGIDVLPNQAIFDTIQLMGLARKKSLKTKLMQKKSVSKQGRTPAKYEPTVHKDPAFDDIDDAMDYMEPEDAHDEGTVKDSKETRVSTKEQVNTDKLKVSTDKPNEGTAEPNEGTAKPKDINSNESVAPTTVFKDDETIAQFLVTMSQNKTKQKDLRLKRLKILIDQELQLKGQS
ncbi:hypothetical protein Tco_0319144 [Tanacetum coccineum]